MDFNRIKTIEEFVIEVRDTLGLDNQFKDIAMYKPLTFDMLTEAIMKSHSDINIYDIHGSSSKYYVIKKKTYIEIPKNLDDFSRLRLLSYSFGAHMLDEFCTDKNVKEYSSLFMYALILPRELFYKALEMTMDDNMTIHVDKVADFLQMPREFVLTRGRHLMIWQ